MKIYKRIFNEARRNPNQNPFIGAWDYLEQYMDDSDVYISFTEVDKIGINPLSKFNTPLGIYCYPLEEFVTNYLPSEIMTYKHLKSNADFRYKKSIGDYAPFAGKAKYINFIKIKSSAKKNFIEDMYTDYGSNDYDRDVKILGKKYKELLLNYLDKYREIFYALDLDKLILENNEISGPIHLWNTIVEGALQWAKVKNPAMSMWALTLILSYILTANQKNASTKWNLILSKDLGYTGFADKSGKGYIHPSEPMQALFLRKNAFEVLHRVENIPNKSKLFPMFKIEDKFTNKNGDILIIKDIVFDKKFQQIEYKIEEYDLDDLDDPWKSTTSEKALQINLERKNFKKSK